MAGTSWDSLSNRAIVDRRANVKRSEVGNVLCLI